MVPPCDKGGKIRVIYLLDQVLPFLVLIFNVALIIGFQIVSSQTVKEYADVLHVSC